MSRVLRVEPEALVELQEAASWYERRRPGLGFEFVEAVESTAARVVELPGAFPAILKSPLIRSALIQQFPYAIVFSIREETIHVLAYAHAKRRPLYWAHRMIDANTYPESTRPTLTVARDVGKAVATRPVRPPPTWVGSHQEPEAGSGARGGDEPL